MPKLRRHIFVLVLCLIATISAKIYFDRLIDSGEWQQEFPEETSSLVEPGMVRVEVLESSEAHKR